MAEMLDHQSTTVECHYVLGAKLNGLCVSPAFTPWASHALQYQLLVHCATMSLHRLRYVALRPQTQLAHPTCSYDKRTVYFVQIKKKKQHGNGA